MPANALYSNILCKYKSAVQIAVKMVCSIEDADSSQFVQVNTFAYFMPKSGNLNILGSYDTQVSERGPPWPSCF